MKDSLRKALDELKVKTAERFGTDHPIELKGMGVIAYSDRMETDERLGVCDDGSLGYVRYKLIDPEHIYKMPARKFINTLVGDIQLSAESCVGISFNVFEREWVKIQAEDLWEKCELVVDDDFDILFGPVFADAGEIDPIVQISDDPNNRDFYRKFDVKAVKLLKDGMVVSAAFLWKEAYFDEDCDSVVLLGRPVGSYPFNTILTDLAVQKKLADYYFTDIDIVDRDGDPVNAEFFVNCEFEVDELPASDPTFQYWDPFKKRIMTMEPCPSPQYRLWRLNNHELIGWYLSNGEKTVEPVVDIYVNGNRRTVTLTDCNENYALVDGRWVRKDAYVVDFQGVNREKCHCAETISGKWIISNVAIFIERHEGFATPDEACNVNGDWELKDDCVQNEDGTWSLKEELKGE